MNKQEMRELIRAELATMVKLLPYSLSTSDGAHDKLSGYQTEGSDEQPYDFEGRRVYPFGHRARPPKGVSGVWVGGRGHSGNGVIIAGESSRFGPSDLDDGEVAFYNKVNGTLIKLDKNGAITITAAAGQTVNINGNTYALPQWNAFMTAFAAFLSTLKTVTNATASIVATAATTIDTARTTASDWKSTKANNG